MSDNYNDVLALTLSEDKAMNTACFNWDSVLEEKVAPGEEIGLLQGISQSNRDLLTLSQLFQVMNNMSHA